MGFAVAYAFTSHYVTINSPTEKVKLRLMFTFTSHYVTINSCGYLKGTECTYAFTSHYVTINSDNENYQNGLF